MIFMQQAYSKWVGPQFPGGETVLQSGKHVNSKLLDIRLTEGCLEQNPVKMIRHRFSATVLLMLQPKVSKKEPLHNFNTAIAQTFGLKRRILKDRICILTL